MTPRRMLPVMLFALIVSGLFTLWLSKHFAKSVAAAPVSTLRFVGASRNIQPGEPLQPGMLQMVEWPASHPLKGTFAKPEELAGRIAVSVIPAGEVILDHSLAPAGTLNGLTARIPEGMRAIALRSDEVAGVAGFLLPGTFVDVLVTYHRGSETDLVTATVLQNVRVLTAGQKMEADPDGKANTASVVTLLVTPQDAEKLTLASSIGKILFVLRNTVDRKEVADLTPQTALPGIAPPHEPETAPAPPAPRSIPKPVAPEVHHYTVQTMAGNKLTEDTFEGKAR